MPRTLPRRTPETRLAGRIRQRGAAAVETAFGLLIVGFVLAAGIHFGDAMVVRHRLTNATSRAARICAVRGLEGIDVCVQQQAVAGMGQMLQGDQPRCNPMQVQTRVMEIGGVQVVQAQATCRYQGGIAQIVRRFAAQANIMVMQAQSTMPIAR